MQSTVSGLFVVSLIMGVFIMAVCPPIGFLIIALGVGKQYGGHVRQERRIRARVLQIQCERAVQERSGRIVAWKSLP